MEDTRRKKDMMSLPAILMLSSMLLMDTHSKLLTIYLSSCKYLHILFRKEINLCKGSSLKESAWRG